MNITIITPCSRPENLEKIKESIINNISCHWVIVYDSENKINKFDKSKWITELNIRGGIFGNLQRNHGLDLIKDYIFYEDEWVYFLDDDNLLHPNFHKLKHIELPEHIKGVIFSQDLGNGQTRLSDKDKVKVCQIDQAQYLLNISLIKNKRFKQIYEADGMFIEEIYNMNKGNFLFFKEVYCYYNKLRRDEK